MEKIISPLKSIILIVLGCIMIVVGGNFVVNSATSIAQAFGLSETLIGLTIVAIGTSLPELVTSIVASRKGENDLSLGNVVGSNIFNILMILGISTTIHPIQLESSFLFDTLFLAAVSVIILIFAKTKGKISRKEGLIMLAFYIAYDAYIILR
jgi:cation:H+ antiporter